MTNERGHVRETEPEMIAMTTVINSEEMLCCCHLPDNGLVKMLMVHPVHGKEGVQPIRGNTGRQLQLPFKSVNLLFWTVQLPNYLVLGNSGRERPFERQEIGDVTGRPSLKTATHIFNFPWLFINNKIDLANHSPVYTSIIQRI